MYATWPLWVAGIFIAGQDSTVDDGAFAILLQTSCYLIATVWLPTKTLRRARAITASHLAASVAGGCFSLGSRFTNIGLGTVAIGTLFLEPAWSGTTVAEQGLGTAIDTELLLALAIATESGDHDTTVRITLIAVTGLALLSFLWTTLFTDAWWQKWLRRISRAAGLATVILINEIQEELSLSQNIVATAMLVWFVLPPNKRGTL
jgi:hypothetical protein